MTEVSYNNNNNHESNALIKGQLSKNQTDNGLFNSGKICNSIIKDEKKIYHSNGSDNLTDLDGIITLVIGNVVDKVIETADKQTSEPNQDKTLRLHPSSTDQSRSLRNHTHNLLQENKFDEDKIKFDFKGDVTSVPNSKTAYNSVSDSLEKDLEIDRELFFEPSLPNPDIPRRVERVSASLSPETDESKNIVTLRNLEVSPKPNPIEESNSTTPDTLRISDSEILPVIPDKKSIKRKAASIKERPTTTNPEQRSKRQRTKTQLFQSPAVAETRVKATIEPSQTPRKTPNRTRKNLNPETPSSTPIQVGGTDLKDVISYEKDDFIAVRNEESSFFLCQCVENVKFYKPFFKIRWLDTVDSINYHMTKQYDKVPQRSIIMPVTLIKSKGLVKQDLLYTLPEEERNIIMDRLKRSLLVSVETSSEPQIT